MADRERKSPAPVESNLRTRASSARAAFSASRAAWSFHSGEMSSMAGSYSPTAAAPSCAPRGRPFAASLAAPLARATAFRASSWSPSLERSVPYVNPSRCPVMTRRPIPFEDACSSCSTSPSRTRTEASRVRSAYASASAAPALRASLTSCSQVSSRFIRRCPLPSRCRCAPWGAPPRRARPARPCHKYQGRGRARRRSRPR